MATRAHLREQITSDKIGALTTVAFATVSVFQTGTTTPVTGTLFSTATGAGTLANPVTADANGVVEFWMASPQVVDLSIVASGYNSATVTAQVIGTSTATGILNLNTTTTPTAAGDVQINGESFTYEGAASLHTVGTLDRAQTYTALQSFGTNLGGTLQTAAQPNITSVGVLASPHMTGAVVDSGGLTVTAGNVGIGGAPVAAQALSMSGAGVGSANTVVVARVSDLTTHSLLSFNGNFTNASSLGLMSQGTDNILYFSAPTGGSLNFRNAGATSVTIVTGITVGSATGGDKLSGINVAGDVFKNNTAYTNPGYVAEHYFTGDIVLFAESPSAMDYPGLLTLDDLSAFMQANLELPRVAEARGAFERHDILLEKVEEQALYILQLHARLKAIGA